MELKVGAIVDWKEGFLQGGWSISIDGCRIISVRPFPGASGSPLVASPGLIQGHVHLCQTIFRGMAEGLPLLTWLSRRIWPLEASHTEETIAASAVLSLREMISSGCTGMLDMGCVEGTATTVDVLRRAGVRALCGNTLMDRGPGWIARDTGWLLEEAGRVKACCGGLVGYAYAPRFALSCSDSLWEWLSRESAGRTRTTHAAETAEEMAEAGIEPPGGNIRFLDRRGFLGQGAVLAHCVHLGPDEAGILASSGTVVAHCPWANLRLGSGIADVPSLAAAGAEIVLGSDGAACNNGLDLASDLRLAMALASVRSSPSSMSSGKWFRSVTQGAAEALGWGSVGRLAPGFEADIVVLELSDLDEAELPGASDPLRYILEMHWPSRVRSVRVAGRELYGEGRFTTLPALPSSLGEMRASLAASAIRLSREAGR